MHIVKDSELHFGIEVTASHNPANYNGIKVIVDEGRDAPLETTAELEALKNHALNASQGYAKFMQEDASLGSISYMFDTSTEFYNYVRKTELWVWTHTGYDFEDISFSEEDRLLMMLNMKYQKVEQLK